MRIFSILSTAAPYPQLLAARNDWQYVHTNCSVYGTCRATGTGGWLWMPCGHLRRVAALFGHRCSNCRSNGCHHQPLHQLVVGPPPARLQRMAGRHLGSRSRCAVFRAFPPVVAGGKRPGATAFAEERTSCRRMKRKSNRVNLEG